MALPCAQRREKWGFSHERPKAEADRDRGGRDAWALCPCPVRRVASAPARSSETEEIMGREGRLIEGPNGAAPHPAFRMQNTAMREARLLAAELGLTPHRRGTGVIEGKPNNDKWEGDLLA